MTRPDWDTWFLDGCLWLARRGDCTRRQVGALIVDTDHRIAGAGYNGSYPGGPSCLKGDCPRGRHAEAPEPSDQWCPNVGYDGPYRGSEHLCSDCRVFHDCLCGQKWPCPDAVAPGSSYDTGPGACIASHAEANALADAQRKGGGVLEDCTMYVSTAPCEGCVRHVRNTTMIAAIRWPDGVIGLP